MFSRRLFLIASAVLTLPASSVFAGEIYEPKRGSSERKAILDALRPVMEARMRGPVEFVIRKLRVEDGWAFVVTDPQRPGGASINIRETAFADEADYMDGLTTYALLRHKNGVWRLFDHAIGPTDVFYEIWPQQFGAPRALLGLR